MADKLIEVEIITPQKVLYSGKAVSVSVPGSLSPFQVLCNHAPVVSSLDSGITKLTGEDGKALFYATSKGFAEVRSNHVSILVDYADDSELIDEKEEKLNLANFRDLIKRTENPDEIESLKRSMEYTQNKIRAAAKFKDSYQ